MTPSKDADLKMLKALGLSEGDLRRRARQVRVLLRGTRLNDAWERGRLGIRPSDVFLVSFPKSGNTLVRFVLTGIHFWVHHGQTVEPDFFNAHAVVPDSHLRNLVHPQTRAAFPRFIKSHRAFTPNYPRVIYVVRDPRDVMVSRYHFENRRGRVIDSLSDLVRDPLLGVDRWVSDVCSWTRSHLPAQGRLLLLRFEDVLSEPITEIERIARFISVDIDPDGSGWVAQMVARDRVKDLERRRGRPRQVPTPFVRSGRSGTWEQEMSQETSAYVVSRAGSVMSDLGYDVQALG